jgi:dTDP-4-dehydrorhamnose reductase
MSQAKDPSSFPEVWGGVECSICRINDSFSDQLAASGHYDRTSDIHDFAALGITALRYPVLWERHQSRKNQDIDWTWTDQRLQAIRNHNIVPIVGLLHHGSGPSFTSLEDPHFGEGLAAYAGQVARRYPWVLNYTPVNEPLTTARFSGLYGKWYPHKTCALACAKMLLNQVKAVVLSMKAIRAVNPSAKLIQTEDIAKIHSKPALAYQADFENERRWLTYDLLCGRVRPGHSLWDYLMFIGIERSELDFFVANPCVPDILGGNYYITSERWLDDGLDKYPPDIHGGNGVDAYADVEAVRHIAPAGLSALLEEIHHRYALPIAITEAHLNCTREEQLRWLNEIWTTACHARRRGVDIRSVTAWALTGAYDWDSLLTRNDGHYESGPFAISGNRTEMTAGTKITEGTKMTAGIKITAVGHLIKALAANGFMDHPLLLEPGWWNRRATRPANSKKLLIVAPDKHNCGLLRKICETRGIDTRFLPSSRPADVREGWGVIDLTAQTDDDRLRAACLLRNLPYLRCSAAMIESKDLPALNRWLDLFIDKAIASLPRRSIASGRRTLTGAYRPMPLI